MVVPALCSVRWAHFHPIVTSVQRADSAQLERCILELNVCFQPLWAVSFGSNGENRSRPRSLSSDSESWPVQGWINVTNCVSGRELTSYLDLVLQVFVCTCMFTCVWTHCVWRDINLGFTPVCQIFSPLSPLLQPTALCTFMCVCACVCAHVPACLFMCKYSGASTCVPMHVGTWGQSQLLFPRWSWFFESGSLIDLEPTSGIHCLHLSSSVIPNMCHHAWLVLHGFWGVELRTQDLKVKYFTGWVISLALFLILCVNVVKEFDVSWYSEHRDKFVFNHLVSLKWGSQTGIREQNRLKLLSSLLPPC